MSNINIECLLLTAGHPHQKVHDNVEWPNLSETLKTPRTLKVKYKNWEITGTNISSESEPGNLGLGANVPNFSEDVSDLYEIRNSNLRIEKLRLTFS